MEYIVHRGYRIMDNQKILDDLSGIESALYYRLDGSDDRQGIEYKDLEEMHNKINDVLVMWHKLTGLNIS